MSFFLLAQSILIAVSAAISSTLAGLHSAHRLVRVEVFGLAVSLDLAGLALTLIFWFIFNMNSNGLAILAERLRALDEMYADLNKKWQEERLRHWYSRILHSHGSNRTVKNFLPPVILMFWCAITVFSVAIFFAGLVGRGWLGREERRGSEKYAWPILIHQVRWLTRKADDPSFHVTIVIPATVNLARRLSVKPGIWSARPVRTTNPDHNRIRHEPILTDSPWLQAQVSDGVR